MFKGLEISVIKDNELIYDFKKLNKKQAIRLFNVAALGLAMFDLDSLEKGMLKVDFNFMIFNEVVGNVPVSGWLLMIGLIIAYFIIRTLKNNIMLSLKDVLENIFYVLVALIPGALLLLIWGGII